jgi:hypothetical protein
MAKVSASAIRRKTAYNNYRQPDFFAEPQRGPLVGLRVKLDRDIDRDRPHCRNIYTIGPGKGPHAGELICVDCGHHRWMSKRAADWLEFVVTRFGAPNTPISVRTSSETALPDAGAAVLPLTHPVTGKGNRNG